VELSRKNIRLWELAEVYLWSACAIATGSSDDSSARQAHVSGEITERTATLAFVSRGAQRSESRSPLFGDIWLPREGVVS
jgi:hypothetical protein